jgi:hypothetical protein
MTKKSGNGTFVKDAMTEDLLEQGIDQIYKLSLSTTSEYLNKDTKEIENAFVQMSVNLSHDSVLKLLKQFNPKRVRWQRGEPPSKEDKEKYGNKARWQWSDYDFVQLRLA